MTDAAGGFPSQDEGLALLQRLWEGIRPAPSDMAGAYLEPLARWLARANPQVHASECDTAAEDAILWLIKHPALDDPAGHVARGVSTHGGPSAICRNAPAG